MITRGVAFALRDWCKRDRWLGWPMRIFYTLKAIACVIFGREWYRVTDGKIQYPDTVDVATISHRTLYAGWEADWLEVGQGIFSNWWYRLEHDSEWNM